MLFVSIFNTITGDKIEDIPRTQLTGDILVTLATGSETSTAVVQVSLPKGLVAGWRNRFAKVDRSIAIWDNTGGTVNVHYAGFIDKVDADGVADGGIQLAIRLSDVAENMKMIKIAKDQTFEAGTWGGVIRAIVEGAFTQPNTPTVAITGAATGGTGKKLEAKASSGGTSYSSLLEEVKTASNGGYAEVSFKPVARTSGSMLTGVSWLATVGASLINIDNTVDVENHEDVYEFTISTDSNSSYSRLTIRNEEGESKVYTNPHGGSVLSDEVLTVDAAIADFDSIATEYMKSDLIASSESHEVHVKMDLGGVRGIVGGAGVLPKAVEYNWSTSVRLRIVQAEYRITPRIWDEGPNADMGVPVELTFAPITNRTWVPPSRADADSTNQDWIDRNKYSGVGRDTYSGAHPGDYAGPGGSGGDGPGPGPDPEGPNLPDFPVDPNWFRGSENLPNPQDAQGRAKPIYGFDLSDVKAAQVATHADGTAPGPQDDYEWWTGRGICTGQSHDGKQVYWSYWSSTDSANAFSHRSFNSRTGTLVGQDFYVDQGVKLPTNSGYVDREYVPITTTPLTDLKLVICAADLVEGDFANPRQVTSLTIDHELHKYMTLDMFMVGTQDDFDQLQEVGIFDDSIENNATRRRAYADIYMGIRGIFTTKDRLILLYETFIDAPGQQESVTINSVRTITFMKNSDGSIEQNPGRRAVSSGGGVKIWRSSKEEDESLKGEKTLYRDVFSAGDNWFGAIAADHLWTDRVTNAGIVFNVYSKNAIDPRSYTPIWSLGKEWPGNYMSGSDFRAYLAVARGTKNNGMSLYAWFDNSNNGGDKHTSFELELANGKPTPRTAFTKWRPAAMYPEASWWANNYVTRLAFNKGVGDSSMVIEGIPLGTGMDWVESASVLWGVAYQTAIFPRAEGARGLGSWTGGSRIQLTLAGDGIQFNPQDAGVTIPTNESMKQRYIRQAGLGRMYYSEGYIYQMTFKPWSSLYGGSALRNAFLDETQASTPFWWYSMKVTPRTKPKDITSSNSTKYNDVPLNPAARRELWSPGEARYPTIPAAVSQ